MKNYILLVSFLLSNLMVFSQQIPGKYPKTYNRLADKNFYLLSAFDSNPKIQKIISNDKILEGITKNKHEEILSIKFDSSDSSYVDQLVESYKYSSLEIEEVGNRLEFLYNKSKEIRSFVLKDIVKSEAYTLYEAHGEEKLLSEAWKLCARGINHVLNTYGKGIAPKYANIDSISYQVEGSYYRQSLFMWNDLITSGSPGTFYSEPMNFALSLLYLNHRDEAVRYEPLRENDNRKTVENIPNIEFSKYRYATVLILGNGPENYKDRLSALGKLNLRLGANRYLAGDAPLVIVSGGHAHPFRAAFAEAIEMKKELIREYNIPENRIIIEPYARHTTTNLRNAARLMKAYHIPMDQPSIVVTNNRHSQYTGSERFKQRCLEELGYLPVIINKRIDETTLEFLPKKESLQQNPLEPLDP